MFCSTAAYKPKPSTSQSNLIEMVKRKEQKNISERKVILADWFLHLILRDSGQRSCMKASSRGVEIDQIAA